MSVANATNNEEGKDVAVLDLVTELSIMDDLLIKSGYRCWLELGTTSIQEVV